MGAIALPQLTRAPSRRRAMPGFGLTLGFTLSYLSLIVLIPLAALAINAAGLGVGGIWKVLTTSQVINALKLSFGGALVAAAVNAVFGSLIAWTFVRYEFPGKRALQAMIDLPFALPTAVAGIALTALYSVPTVPSPGQGWLGVPLEALGIKVAYTRLGVIVAMTFISLPFVVRTLEPVLEQVDRQYEEAAATLGATRWQAVSRIVFPALQPALLTGTALAFARAVGEYGSIIFIAGNLPNLTQIAPLLIAIDLDQHEVGAATAIAVAMLALSFAILFGINLLQTWTRRSERRTA
ncbi:MAG: sulfate ABC transporter permease subunit CysT [Proteobacteria bacterium]|uniref:sulfate ABC transporter permease subunit CysT n=1 Tax=Rudaea sp. TaxID=2136325 RepID=UPI00321FC692|nr:sulfate ABC transporter permease subunit CysT [Pseudomonadota bacterium]